jgi:acyl-CoA thioesterase
MSKDKKKLQLAQACADEMMSSDNASQALGIGISIIKPGVAEARMTVRADMVNGHNRCHGGLIFALADSAFAFACNSYNEAAVAASASVDFLRAAKLGDELIAEAREAHKGKRLGVYDVEVHNQAGETVAVFRGRSTFLGWPVIPVSDIK